MHYLIIESYAEHIVVVPNNWMLPSQNQYYWPQTCNKSQLDKLLLTHPDPEEDWFLYRVLRVYCAKISYDTAHGMIQDMDYYPNTESKNSFKRKIQEIIPSDENNDEDVESSSLKKSKLQDELLLLNQNTAHDLPSDSISLNGETNLNISIVEALSTLTTAIKGIHEDISHLNKKFEFIIKNVKLNTDDESTLFLEDFWPWTNEAQMIEAEASMKNDQAQFNRTIRMLKRIGGTDSVSFVINILKKTMVDNVAILYSWAGKKKKKSFSDTFPTFVKVISVVSRYHYQSLTDEDIKQNVSRWLKQAPLRCFRTKLKQEKTYDEDEAYDEKRYDDPSS